MLSLHLFGAPCGASHFFVRAIFLLGLCCLPALADDLVVLRVPGSDFRTAHEGLLEAIESEGLVVGSVLPFRDMLERTKVATQAIPYREAEIVQFCSSLLAAELVRENPAQLSLCPMSVALYTLADDAAEVRLAYRTPEASTPGRRQAIELLQRIVQRAAELARLRW